MSKLVAGDGAIEPSEPDKSEAERLRVRRMFRWLSAGAIVFLIGLILLIINKGFVHNSMFQALAFFFLIGGLAIATFGRLSSIMKETYLPGKPSKSPEQINQKRATKELTEGQIPIPVPSVTERTTQLIGKDANRK